MENKFSFKNFFVNLKDRNNIFFPVSLLVVLILPRLLAYVFFGTGIITTDAQFRYFPQVEQFLKSPGILFSQTGPLYTLFLLLFKEVFNNMVAGPVLFQHVVGIVTALLVFIYFRKVNMPLAFLVVVASFCFPLSIWIEHSILRESISSFLLVAMVILASLAVKDNKYFKISFGFLAGLCSAMLVFLRIEFAVLVVLMPFVFFMAKRRMSPDFRINDRLFLKWLSAYFSPLIIVFLLFVFMPKHRIMGVYSTFSIAYYNLPKEAYYYKNPAYPELLEKYHEVLQKDKPIDKTVEMLNQETENYLLSHKEIKFSETELMDKIYIEIMTKNTFIYIKAVAVNLKNQFLGIAEINSMILKYRSATGFSLFDSLFWLFNILTIGFYWVLFIVSLLSLPVFFIKWKTLPYQVFISFWAGLIHLFVLTIVANPAHRFRYEVDPFIYFFQFYSIFIFLKTIISNFKKRTVTRNLV